MLTYSGDHVFQWPSLQHGIGAWPAALIRSSSSSESSPALTEFARTLASRPPSDQRDIQGQSMHEQYSRAFSVLLFNQY